MDSLVIANADHGILPGYDHGSVDGVRVPVQLAQHMRILASRQRGHGFLPSKVDTQIIEREYSIVWCMVRVITT